MRRCKPRLDFPTCPGSVRSSARSSSAGTSSSLSPGPRFPDVVNGRGQTLLLAGDAGIGRTRLLGAVERRASDAGFQVAIGVLSPRDQDVPAAAILDLARSVRRLPDLAPLGRALLDRLANPQVDVPIEVGRRRRLLVLDVVDAIGDA